MAARRRHGWRLDVADELSDDFLAEIKKAVLAEKPDALLLGEVWEDASNKISYGHLRRYLQGSELDSAMDYPFRDMVIGFLMGYKNAYQAAEDIETLRENYPREALSCALNLLSSHDRPRIISVLGGGPDESQLPESERSKWRLDENSMGLAKSRFWLATLMQMTFPGVPRSITATNTAWRASPIRQPPHPAYQGPAPRLRYAGHC